MYKSIIASATAALLFAVSLQPVAAKTWEQTNAAGFGDTANIAATLVKVGGKLFAVTDNAHGVQLFKYHKGSDSWSEETDVTKWGFLDDNANVGVSTKLRKSSERTLLAFENQDSGATVWRMTKDGATRLSYDGFGNTAYTEVHQLLKFHGWVLAYAENAGDGNVRVLKKPTDGSLSWTFMNDLPASYAEGLDAAVVYDNTIYLANGDPAEIYRSIDGINYSSVVALSQDVATQIADFQVEGDVLYAAGTARRNCYESVQSVISTRDGSNWLLDETTPNKAFCYSQIVLKSNSSTAYFLGFDTEDAVVYKRHDQHWTKQTASGMNGSGGTATSNRQFSDGVWYGGNIVLATQNETDGIQIWSKR